MDGNLVQKSKLARCNLVTLKVETSDPGMSTVVVRAGDKKQNYCKHCMLRATFKASACYSVRISKTTPKKFMGVRVSSIELLHVCRG